MKRCNKCGEVKPLDAFGNNRSRYDGKCAYCKNCYRLMFNERYRRDPKAHNKRTNRWRKKNRDKDRGYQKAYREKNKPLQKERLRKWRSKNLEKVREHKRKSNQKAGVEISDYYCKKLIWNMIKRIYGLSISRKDIPQSLIKAKREEILTLRKLREIQNEKRSASKCAA